VQPATNNATASNTPGAQYIAILLMRLHLLSQRTASLIGATASDMPMVIDALIVPISNWFQTISAPENNTLGDYLCRIFLEARRVFTDSANTVV
jgi:hypothetical protein